jgi:ribosomal protein S18 acetylase RimI-like enzyme
MGAGLEFRRPALLQDHHIRDAFDSGKLALDVFLKTMAQHNQVQGYSRTYVIADNDFNVVGYHSLCAGMIWREHSPRQVKGHQAPTEIPVALLARLAVDRTCQGRGLGGKLLKHALLSVLATAETIAFRAVMVHALDDEAVKFYSRYGFRQAKGLERTLLLPIKDIAAALA